MSAPDDDDDLIRQLRDLPQPDAPPTLARDIAAAIDREEARARSPWARLRAWLVRPVVGVTLAAVTAGGIGLWIAQRGRTIEEVGVVTPPAPIDSHPTAPAPAPPHELFRDAPATAGELADLETLDDKALDRLGADLNEELVGDTTAADEDLMPQPDLEWVDELSSDEVDSLDQYFTAHPKGSHT